jgi:hypothetical protein
MKNERRDKEVGAPAYRICRLYEPIPDAPALDLESPVHGKVITARAKITIDYFVGQALHCFIHQIRLSHYPSNLPIRGKESYSHAAV